MVEVLVLDEQSKPDEVQRTLPIWRNLSTPSVCQTIPRQMELSNRPCTYGPRQAEYVAQLMHFEVETGQFHEAFDHCFWDETMEDLMHLDQIDKASRQSNMIDGIQQPELMRQIEGSTLWTLLAMGDEHPDSGSIDWYGTTFQHGFLSQLPEENVNRFYQSLQEDCNFAAQVIAQQEPINEDGIKIISYGYFGVYQGQRTHLVPPERLHLWQLLVTQQWTDHENVNDITTHIAMPQPHGNSFALHVVVRSVHTPVNHRFLLVDQVEESPQAAESRSVIEVSQQPNGYELLLTSGLDLNTVTSSTVLKHGNRIWQHHQILPVQDGQYWRILLEASGDETTLMQSSLGVRQGSTPLASTPRERPFHPHVLDLWCDGRDNLDGVPRSNRNTNHNGIDEASFMQSAPPGAHSTRGAHQFFRMEEGHFRLRIPQEEGVDLHTHIENHLKLPTEGPHSIRTLHWVTSPPNLLEPTYQVHIVEFRGDADQRLMNDDVICLFLLTIAHPTDVNDYSERFRVLWTPRIASRERILLHLRTADLCRDKTCHIYMSTTSYGKKATQSSNTSETVTSYI